MENSAWSGRRPMVRLPRCGLPAVPFTLVGPGEFHIHHRAPPPSGERVLGDPELPADPGNRTASFLRVGVNCDRRPMAACSPWIMQPAVNSRKHRRGFVILVDTSEPQVVHLLLDLGG